MPASPLDPPPNLFVWLTAVIVSAGICKTLLTFALSPPIHVAVFAMASVGLAAAGRFVLPSRPLQVAAALLLPQTLSGQLELGSGFAFLQFLPAAAALAVASAPAAAGSAPLLLLDDVMSELDAARRSTLLAVLDDVPQAILTTTDWEDFSPTFRARAHCFHVASGIVTSTR